MVVEPELDLIVLYCGRRQSYGPWVLELTGARVPSLQHSGARTCVQRLVMLQS
jgi:hypothetical protein